jgi:hypothetical protein
LLCHRCCAHQCQSSALCLDTLVVLFRADADGQASLEAVRLLNRMIKERRFAVHPAVLSCLLHLRLHSELGVRASETHADKEQKKAHTSGKAAARRAKGKAADAPHLSKKAKTALKEKKEIEREMREAGAEVDKEERATNVRLVFASCQCARLICGDPAYGDAQAALCAVLPDSEGDGVYTAAVCSAPWYISLRAPRQRRLLQRPHHHPQGSHQPSGCTDRRWSIQFGRGRPTPFGLHCNSLRAPDRPRYVRCCGSYAYWSCPVSLTGLRRRSTESGSQRLYRKPVRSPVTPEPGPGSRGDTARACCGRRRWPGRPRAVNGGPAVPCA